MQFSFDGATAIGRPPSCSCHCNSTLTNCPFIDDFSTAKTGYSLYSSPHNEAPGPTFTVTGGKLVQSGTATDFAGYSQSVGIGQAGRRAVSVTANLYGPANTSGFWRSGLFVGGIAEVLADWNAGRWNLWACDSAGTPTNQLVSGNGITSGDSIQLLLQEISLGNLQCVISQNGSVAAELDINASGLSNPFNIGVGTQSNVVGSNLAWDNLDIECAGSGFSSSGCLDFPGVHWPAIASVWKVPAVTGLASASNNPCAPCSLYDAPDTLYFNPQGLESCRFASLKTVSCTLSLNGRTFQNIPIWAMAVIPVPPNNALTMVLQSASPGIVAPATYELPASSFNPLGPNTMPRTQYGNAGCDAGAGFPTSITVTPA